MAIWARNGKTITWELENGGWAWIDHVTIDDIDCIEIEEEMITLYKRGKEVANSIKGYVNEVGFYEYDEKGKDIEESRKIVYEY